MVSLSTSVFGGSASVSGFLSGGVSSIGAAFSVPLGSGFNLSNTLGIPWFDFVLGALGPQEGGVLPTTINAFAAQLTTTITNLLGG
jgi:hypothetical protein